MEEALGELILRAENGQGIGILTAAPGTGKTLLCGRLIAELCEKFVPAFIASTNFPTRRALLQTILYELGLHYAGLDEQELRLELLSAVRKMAHAGRCALLVVDEAHLLSDRLLEEVRVLADLSEDGTPLIRVILCGQLSLEERLTNPALEALNQRVACHVYLEPFTREQSVDYIDYRLNWAGGDLNRIFTPDALEMIAHVCNGLPRCINQLCDHSLLLAYVAESHQVDPRFVADALADLKQLPLHWNDPLPAAMPVEPAASHDTPNGSTDGPTDVHDAGANFSGEHSIVFEVGAEPSRIRLEAGEMPLPHDTAAAPPESSVRYDGHHRNLSGNIFETTLPALDDAIDESSPHTETIVPSEQATWHGHPTDGHLSDQDFFSLSPAPSQGIVPLVVGYDSSVRLFEEEPVVDRYADLDAGLTPAPVQKAAIKNEEPSSHPSIEEDDDSEDHSGHFSQSVEPLSQQIPDEGEAQSLGHCRPDLRIDEIIPLLRGACEADSSDFDEESRFVADADLAGFMEAEDLADDVEVDDTTDETEMGDTVTDDLEERIGAAVLEVCLEVEESIVGPVDLEGGASAFEFGGGSAFGDDGAGDAIHDDQRHVETVVPAGEIEPDPSGYDVIEPDPELTAPSSLSMGQSHQFSDPPVEPGQPPKPNYKRIFSTLRRKQRQAM